MVLTVLNTDYPMVVIGINTPCIEHKGAVNKQGYGRKWYKGHETTAHRVAYMNAYGEESVIGLDVDHLCDNRRCIRLDHLVAIPHKANTNKSNSPTGINSRKIKCDAGHELSGDNLYEKYGYRYCRACRRKAARDYKRRKAGVGVGAVTD